MAAAPDRVISLTGFVPALVKSEDLLTPEDLMRRMEELGPDATLEDVKKGAAPTGFTHEVMMRIRGEA